MQLIRAGTPDVPNQTPPAQLSKQRLNVCPIPPLYDCCRAVKVPCFLPMKVKAGAGPYPQPERGKSISPTGKGPVRVSNRKWAMHKAWIRANLLHCVRTMCILRMHRPGYSPKNTCHLTSCKAKQQSPHENNETAFNLVLHCPYEQTTQSCKVRLLRVFRCLRLRSWRRR